MTNRAVSLYVCDWIDCDEAPVKVVALRGYSIFARFSEDQMDLCPKHAMEILNLLYNNTKKPVKKYGEEKAALFGRGTDVQH